MPGTPNPITGPLGPVWTPVVQALQAQKQNGRNLAAQAQQGNLWDQYYNCVEVAGPNIAQVVTIGASQGVGGVQAHTGFASGTAGRAVQQNLATGTLTLTAGSDSATSLTTTAGTFVAGMTIGVVTSTGENAITGPATTNATRSPLTTILSVSGTTLTLSQTVATGGSGLYACACNFVEVEAGPWSTLTVPSGFTVPGGYFHPASRRVTGDTVELRGVMQNTSGSTLSGTLLQLPTAMQPTSSIYFPGGALTVTGGWISSPGGVAAGGYAALDSLRFSLF